MSIPNPPLPDEVAISGPWTANIYSQSSAPPSGPPPLGNAGVSGNNPYITWQDLAVNPNRWFQALDTNNTWQILTATGPTLPTSWTLLLQLSPTQLSLYALQLTGASLPAPPTTPGQQPWFVAAYVGTEANPRFTVDPGGALAWGPGGGSATDVTLSRVATGILQVGGGLRVTGSPSVSTDVATKSYVDTKVGSYLPLSGGTLTGALTLAADPAQPLQAATKQYVDKKWMGFPTYSGITQSSITVGASPFTYTNNDGTLETVYITGGTVSSINFIRNGVSTQLATTLSGDSVVILSPGDSVQVTYSSAPTMTKVLA